MKIRRRLTTGTTIPTDAELELGAPEPIDPTEARSLHPTLRSALRRAGAMKPGTHVVMLGRMPWARVKPTGGVILRYRVTYGHGVPGGDPTATTSLHLTRRSAEHARANYLERATRLYVRGLGL